MERLDETIIDLLDLDKDNLQGLVAQWGEPAYRASQIERWIYHSLVENFDDMSDLPHSLRSHLEESARIGSLSPLVTQTSKDALTRKVLFKLADGQTLETVLMLYEDTPARPPMQAPSQRSRIYRRTVCISTQVGCPIGCPFCATGQAGYVRNLTAGEIVGQVLYFAREGKSAGFNKTPVTNVVIMGMGEPLMKFDITWRAIQALIDPSRFGLGARRITVSTSGLVPGIARLTQLKPQINLAVSLHAPDDELRDILVPLNHGYPLNELLKACREYVALTRRRITFEYALMQDVNDRPEQAHRLAKLLQGFICHVNLIPLNPTGDSSYRRSSPDRVKAFQRILDSSGIPTTLRVEKGIEIAAGCGQLRQVESEKADGRFKPREEMDRRFRGGTADLVGGVRVKDHG